MGFDVEDLLEKVLLSRIETNVRIRSIWVEKGKGSNQP